MRPPLYFQLHLCFGMISNNRIGIQIVALSCFIGFIKSLLGNSTSRWGIIQLQCNHTTYELQEKLQWKLKRTLRNNLTQQSVVLLAVDGWKSSYTRDWGWRCPSMTCEPGGAIFSVNPVYKKSLSRLQITQAKVSKTKVPRWQNLIPSFPWIAPG